MVDLGGVQLAAGGAFVVVVDLGIHDHADDVVAGVVLAFRHQAVEDLEDPDLGQHLLFGEARIVGAGEGLVGECVDLIAHAVRDVQQLADDVQRQLQRELLRHVELRLAAETVEQLPATLPDVGLQCIDAPRGEDLADDLAVPAMLRRVLGDEQRLGLLEWHLLDRRSGRAGEAREIIVRRHHVGVAAQQPEVQLLVAIDRRFLAEAGEDRVGVAESFVVVRVVLKRHREGGHLAIDLSEWLSATMMARSGQLDSARLTAASRLDRHVGRSHDRVAVVGQGEDLWADRRADAMAGAAVVVDRDLHRT